MGVAVPYTCGLSTRTIQDTLFRRIHKLCRHQYGRVEFKSPLKTNFQLSNSSFFNLQLTEQLCSSSRPTGIYKGFTPPRVQFSAKLRYALFSSINMQFSNFDVTLQFVYKRVTCQLKDDL